MDLRELYPGAPLEALDLLRQCLMFNPASRITVDEALNHPFLREARQMGATVRVVSRIWTSCLSYMFDA